MDWKQLGGIPWYDNQLKQTEQIAIQYAIEKENENRSTSTDGL